MRIQVQKGARDSRFTHTIVLLDLPNKLEDGGLPLQRVASGSRESPTILTVLRESPPGETVLDLPVNIEVKPDSTQAALNAKIEFEGLREELDERFGVGRHRGRGSKLSLRVYLPDFDGTYIDLDNEEFGETSNQPRDRVIAAILQRRGAKTFRDSLLRRYQSQCVISGCTVSEVLEAAHIRPYRHHGDNNPRNGLLLRADLHTLFDLDMLGIDPASYRIHLHPDVRCAEYAAFEDNAIALHGHELDLAALEQQWDDFNKQLHA